MPGGGVFLGYSWDINRLDEFTREQLAEYRARGLADDRFGAYAARERRLPEQNIRTLELIVATPELKEEYR